MAIMNIQQQDNGKKGSFFLEEDGKRVAEMTYVWAGIDLFIVEHTEVDESLEGRGVGKQLVQQAVAFAREKNVKLLPLCPFTKAVIDKTPAYQDVLRQP
jgi:predicted GNAT family acetyltransferase